MCCEKYVNMFNSIASEHLDALNLSGVVQSTRNKPFLTEGGGGQPKL